MSLIYSDFYTVHRIKKNNFGEFDQWAKIKDKNIIT